MKNIIRFDEIEFDKADFFGEDGFDIHLSFKFYSQFEKQFNLVGSAVYPVIKISCSADGEIIEMSFDDGTPYFDVIELTNAEKSDVIFFLEKHNLIFEHAEQNEFPIGPNWKDEFRIGAV